MVGSLLKVSFCIDRQTHLDLATQKAMEHLHYFPENEESVHLPHADQH